MIAHRFNLKRLKERYEQEVCTIITTQSSMLLDPETTAVVFTGLVTSINEFGVEIDYINDSETGATFFFPHIISIIKNKVVNPNTVEGRKIVRALKAQQEST